MKLLRSSREAEDPIEPIQAWFLFLAQVVGVVRRRFVPVARGHVQRAVVTIIVNAILEYRAFDLAVLRHARDVELQKRVGGASKIDSIDLEELVVPVVVVGKRR